MIVTKPQFHLKEKIIGVYKITFDNKWIYFGCSQNLKVRFQAWEHKFRTGVTRNVRIRELIKTTLSVSIEIVEVFTNDKQALFKETTCISENSNNPYLLNYVNKPKVRIWKGVSTKIPVAQFNQKGEFIALHESISVAGKIFGKRKLDDFFKGEARTVKGFLFKKITDAKDESIPSIRPRKKRVLTKPIVRAGTTVLQLDKNGVQLNKFEKVKDAAEHFNVTRSIISRAILKRKGKYREFIFKYAESY